MIKNLQKGGLIVLILAVLFGLSRLFVAKDSVAGVGTCPTGTCSTITGGLFVGLANQGDTFSAGQVTPNFTIGGTQGSAYAGGGETFGGGVFSTTTQGSNTLPPSAFFSTSTPAGNSMVNDLYNLISIGSNAPATSTITLTASSSFPSTYLPNPGDMDEVYFYNATTTYTSNVAMQIVAGTGFLITSATTSPAYDPGAAATTTGFTLLRQALVKVEIVRLPSTDLRAIVY